MAAKDKQLEFLKEYLKPTLKDEGWRTSGQTWWKNNGEFFTVINLQNSQWNDRNELSFCLNIGIALTEKLSDPDKCKATYNDLASHLREDAFLSEERKKQKYRQGGWLGYLITDHTDLQDFIKEFKIDFEDHLLPKLNSLITIDDCLEFFSHFGFWGESLKRQVEQLRE